MGPTGVGTGQTPSPRKRHDPRLKSDFGKRVWGPVQTSTHSERRVHPTTSLFGTPTTETTRNSYSPPFRPTILPYVQDLTRRIPGFHAVDEVSDTPRLVGASRATRPSTHTPVPLKVEVLPRRPRWVGESSSFTSLSQSNEKPNFFSINKSLEIKKGKIVLNVKNNIHGVRTDTTKTCIVAVNTKSSLHTSLRWEERFYEKEWLYRPYSECSPRFGTLQTVVPVLIPRSLRIAVFRHCRSNLEENLSFGRKRSRWPRRVL